MRPPERFRKHYTDDELQFIADHVTRWRVETIARHIGRTRAGVQRTLWNWRLRPTNQDLITSGEARLLTGYSQQWLNRLARERRVRAHRIPGGRWWLFDPRSLAQKKGEKTVDQIDPNLPITTHAISRYRERIRPVSEAEAWFAIRRALLASGGGGNSRRRGARFIVSAADCRLVIQAGQVVSVLESEQTNRDAKERRRARRALKFAKKERNHDP